MKFILLAIIFDNFGNYLFKSKVFTHEAFNRVLSLPMRHLNINVPYFSTSTKENKTRSFKSLLILKKMHSVDTNVFASNIIDKYES